MRESNPHLWPQATQGGGRGAAHVTATHLTNVALAVALADTIATAPKVVPGYRNLIPHNPEQHRPDHARDGTAASYLKPVFAQARPLGAGLDQLIEVMTNARAAADLEAAGLYVELYVDSRVPRAVIGFRTFDSPEDHTAPLTQWIYRPRNTPAGVSRELDPAWNFLPPLLITRTALIPASLFTVLATLWSDTKQRLPARRTKPSLPAAASTSATPEAENPTALPEAAGSRLNQPSTESERPGRQTARKLGAREKISKRRSVAALNEE
jgi:hypothetical protein